MYKIAKDNLKNLMVVGTVLSIVSPYSLLAKDVKMYNNAPSAEEMGNILFSDEASAPRMRSISFSVKKPAVNMQEETTKSIPEAPQSQPQTAMATDTMVTAKPKTIGLPIKFESNSSAIMDESLSFLNEVGKMMAMDDSRKLLIEGHTDAKGSEDYNFLLSYKRAKAIRSYLVQNFNIPVNSLKVNGKGESEPLEGSNPNDSINRRVQFYKAN